MQAVGDCIKIKNPKAAQYISAILHNLTQHESLCRDIYEDGGVLLLVSLCKVSEVAFLDYGHRIMKLLFH